MTATIIGTLPFLATLWLLVVLSAKILEESGAKIAAALKGGSTTKLVPPARRAGGRLSVREPMRFERRLRAAA